MSNRIGLPSKWQPATKTFFRSVYRDIAGMQNVMAHPKAPVLPKAQWDTVAWNSAWIAAEYFQARSFKRLDWVVPSNAKCRKAAARGQRLVSA